MRLPLRFILVLLSLASFHGLRAQTVCGTEDPFLTPPEKTFCVDSSGTVFIEFNLTNKGTEAGNYTITFPDGIDSTYLGVVGEVRVTHTMSFDCGGQIWDAELPTEADPFYAYKSKLVILRTDCTDAEGKPQRGSFDFNVLPNPIKDIQISDVTCRAAPYLVDLSAQLCDEDLVDTYTWYLDGDRIAGADEQSVTDVLIRRPGMHTIRLEVTTASDKCPSFTFEKDINITAAPSIDLDYTVLDALCSSVIRINTIATVTNATTYRWSSPSPEVSFSDPEALNPTVTINNEQPGSRTIILTANSENCGRVVESFTIETFTEQMVEPRSPLSVCTNVPLALGDQLVYSPAPDRITWSSPDPEVSIDGATTEDPQVTVTTPGTFTLTASGTDVCGQAFSTTVPVRVRDGSPLEVDFSAVDTLCPTEAPLDLRQYVSNPGNLSTITGPGVTGTLLDVSNLAGPLRLEITDSCGGVYPVEFFVLTEGEFAGGNPVVCQGQTLDLDDLQPGTYRGPGVVNNRFESAGLAEGNYTVEYTSTAYCGGSGQFTITVDPPVTASFRLASDSCGTVVPPGIAAVYRTDDPVALVNTSTAPVISYTIVETGEQLLGQDSTTFTLATAGRYTLQQVVGFPGATCSDTAVQVIEVRAPFDVAFDVAVDSSACDSLTYSFTASGVGEGVSYDWRFSTGDSSDVQNPILRIARPVTRENLRTTVVVTNGCYQQQDTLYGVLPRRFQVGFGILNDNNEVCSGDTAFLIDNSVGATRLRVVLNGSGETDALPPFLVLENTTAEVIAYPILIEGFNATCPAQIARDTLFILPVATEAGFRLEFENGCTPAEVRLINFASLGATSRVTWGDGSTPQFVAERDTIYHTYLVERDTTFRIQMISKQCGVDTFVTTFTARAGANAAFMIDPTVANCIDNELSFFPVVPAATQSLVWDFGDGGTSILPQPVYAYDSVGDYRVSLRVTNENGCTATDSLDVSIGSYAGPPLRASIPTEICVDAPYNLSLRGFGTEITYDYGNQLRSAVPIERPYQVDTTYRLVLTATDAAGCTIDTSAMVRVYPRFTVGILPEEEVVTVEFGSPLDLSFQMEPIRLLDSIRWSGDSLSSQNTQRTQADPIEDGIYRLAVTDEFGCLATDSIRVNVTKEYGDRIYVPNAFSPNGDGQNETFGIDVKPNTVRAIHAVRILSRWGALVYECTDCKPVTAGTGWDGRVGDQPSKPDVYVWIADIEFTDGHREVFRGDVALLR